MNGVRAQGLAVLAAGLIIVGAAGVWWANAPLSPLPADTTADLLDVEKGGRRLLAPPGATAEDDLGTCVACCLFEDIPTMPKALQDMPRWWKLDDVVLMKPIFCYHAGVEGYAQILARFAEKDVQDIQRIEWELEG